MKKIIMKNHFRGSITLLFVYNFNSSLPVAMLFISLILQSNKVTKVIIEQLVSEIRFACSSTSSSNKPKSVFKLLSSKR